MDEITPLRQGRSHGYVTRSHRSATSDVQYSQNNIFTFTVISEYLFYMLFETKISMAAHH